MFLTSGNYSFVRVLYRVRRHFEKASENTVTMSLLITYALITNYYHNFGIMIGLCINLYLLTSSPNNGKHAISILWNAFSLTKCHLNWWPIMGNVTGIFQLITSQCAPVNNVWCYAHQSVWSQPFIAVCIGLFKSLKHDCILLLCMHFARLTLEYRLP